jgi:hypothetical protein
MSGIIKTTNIGNESGSYTLPVRYLSRRIIQRTSYTHRVGWWRGNNSYYWVPGAYIDFRPQRSDSRIKVSFAVPTRAYGSQHMIMHWIFYRDEVEYGRHTRGGHHVENAFSTDWDIPSWGAGQYSRLGYKCRSYSEGNHNAHLYLTQYWDGGGASNHIQGQVIVEEYIPPWDGNQLQVFGKPGTYSWTAPAGVTSVDVLVVGGGGGGGMDMGGGGGGGGVVYQSPLAVTPGTTYNVTVGAGGWGAPEASGGVRGDGVGTQPGSHNFTINGTNGGNSIFGSITAVGGGYGGTSYRNSPLGGIPGNGGSGGGASGYNNDGGSRPGGTGTAGQGFNGGSMGSAYYSGGGGGAGGAGTSGNSQANGGPGIANAILGPTYYWGGGGGGSAYSLGTGGNGGLGGGGGGAVGTTFGGIGGITNGQAGAGGSPNSQTNTRGGDGGPGTGGGGGGGSHYTATNKGGDGGHGIVIVRWRLASSD